MRALVLCALAVSGSMALSGCGGSSFKGTLGGGTGSPQPDKGQPVVTGVSPATVVAGGPSFTITVTGTNFASGDKVEWNDFPLDSTFISSTKMTALVPNTLLYETGTIAIIVQTPTPYSLNFGSTLTVTAPPPPGAAGFTLSRVDVQANDMVWDPASQKIYLSIASTDSTHANTIAALDPVSGQFDASVSATANRLAVASDGSWLYAGIDASGTVQRFTLPGLSSDLTIPLGTDSLARPNFAVDLAVAPGSPSAIAVAQAGNVSEAGELVIYDGSVSRANIVSNVGGEPHPLGSMAWSKDSSHLYAAFNQIYEDTVAVISVNSSGAQLAQIENLNPTSSAVTLGNIHYSAFNGYLYGDNGQVIDPSAAKIVNQLPINALTQGFVSGDVLTLDDNLGMVWVAGQAIGGQLYVIEAFDLKTSALLGSISIPNVVGVPYKLIRWGSNGLAFLTTGHSGPEQGDGVYIVSGAFVTTPSIQAKRTPGSLH